MPKARIPPGKIYTQIKIGRVYATKPEYVMSKENNELCMKITQTTEAMGMRTRPPEAVFFIKGTQYFKAESIELSLIKSYGELKICAAMIFPTRIINKIAYADKDKGENIHFGVGIFQDEEGKEFLGFYVRGNCHLERPSYYGKEPRKWKTWCEFHMPFDFLESLKQILILDYGRQTDFKIFVNIFFYCLAIC